MNLPVVFATVTVLPTEAFANITRTNVNDLIVQHRGRTANYFKNHRLGGQSFSAYNYDYLPFLIRISSRNQKE